MAPFQDLATPRQRRLLPRAPDSQQRAKGRSCVQPGRPVDPSLVVNVVEERPPREYRASQGAVQRVVLVAAGGESHRLVLARRMAAADGRVGLRLLLVLLVGLEQLVLLRFCEARVE